MKFASIRVDGRHTYGLVDGDAILEPPAAFCADCVDLRSVLFRERLDEAAAAARTGERWPQDTVDFDPVIRNPGKILCVGINYVSHMKEMRQKPPKYPWLFVRFADSQVGHRQPMIRPRDSEKYDYEGELAVIIGKRARHVKAKDASAYVAGYTCFNDGTLRDFQGHGSQFTPGKNFHRSGSFGPWLVTTDEIPDPAALTLETRLNGETMQSGDVSDLRFAVGDLIEYCSTFCQLEAGDVISTGTPGGVGFARKPQVWMTAGDTIEIEISGIGVLSNPIADES